MLGLHPRVHLLHRPRYVHVPVGPHRVILLGAALVRYRGFPAFWGTVKYVHLDRCCQARRDQFWVTGHP